MTFETIAAGLLIAAPAYIYVAWILRQKDFASFASTQRAISIMQETLDNQAEEIAEILALRETDHRQMERLRAETAYYRTEQGYATEVLVTLVAQLENLHIPPERKLDPNRPLPKFPQGEVPISYPDAEAILAARIVGAYDLEELMGLAFSIGVDMEQVGGTTKAARVTNLIRYADRHGKLPELREAAKKGRPHVTW